MEKSVESKMGKLVKVVEGMVLEPDFADDSQMDLPWQRNVQSESDEDEKNELASMWT